MIGCFARAPHASLVAMLTASLLAGGCASPAATDEMASELAAQMARAPIVLLGEHHDNVVQHAARAEALRRLFAAGARPAVAFEQFDHDRQVAIDAARARVGGNLRARADRVIAAAGGQGWNWDFYRPYVEVALQYDVPIVAANLSRADAMRVALDGFGTVFDASRRQALGLEPLPEDLLRAQRQTIDEGHCHRLPAESLDGMARAQIARDAMLASSIAPYAQRGVVLLTGNGHARRDWGLVRFLPADQRARTISIGLLEQRDRVGGEAAPEDGAFDKVFMTPEQPRADPCASIPLSRGMPPRD